MDGWMDGWTPQALVYSSLTHVSLNEVSWKRLTLTFCRQMEFSIKLHTIHSGWSIVYNEGSQGNDFTKNIVHVFLSLEIIRIYHECEGRLEKSIPRTAVWHHEASRVIPRDRFFYPTLTRIMDYFSCSSVFFYFKIRFQKSLYTLRCNLIWWYHLYITMTSLDDHVREFQYNQCM